MANLLRQVFGLWKKDCDFDPEFETKQAEKPVWEELGLPFETASFPPCCSLYPAIAQSQRNVNNDFARLLQDWQSDSAHNLS